MDLTTIMTVMMMAAWMATEVRTMVSVGGKHTSRHASVQSTL